VLVISNHKCDLDYFFAWATAARLGVLQPGHFNAVAKGVLRKVPLFGWLFKLVGFLFLARSWEADRDRIVAWCSAAAARKRPQWLVLYPEGTRFTPKAKDKSDAAAREHGMQPLDGELLLPRPKGFVELSKALPAAGFTHILDMTLCYISSDGTTPLAGQQLGTSALVRLGAGSLPMSRVDVHCALFPLSDVAGAPSDDARRDWLLQRWKHKEKLLQRAVATGTLTEGPHPAAEEAPVPLGRTAWMAALATAAMGAFIRLMTHSGLFRWCGGCGSHSSFYARG
jgi:1-acyl-sn-glycerol-3-phosphate acyltransferase